MSDDRAEKIAFLEMDLNRARAMLAAIEAQDLDCGSFAILIHVDETTDRMIGPFADPFSAIDYGDRYIARLDRFDPPDIPTTYKVMALHDPEKG